MEGKFKPQADILKKRLVVVAVNLLISAAHVLPIRTYLSGRLYVWFASFFFDVVIPIGIYFLLTMVEDSIPLLRSWKAKAALSFGIVAVSEIVQAFGIYFFGSTFDPLDLVMFGAGVLLAAGLDRLFSAVFPFWSGEAAPAPA